MEVEDGEETWSGDLRDIFTNPLQRRLDAIERAV
jgi:hypothetical protein